MPRLVYNLIKSPKDIKSHPLNLEIYGDEPPDTDLIESIQTNGILEPIVINDEGQIVSGHRRWLAAKELNLKKVPCRSITFSNLREEEKFLIESNRQRIKTPQQSTNEIRHLQQIISAELAEKQKNAGTLGAESGVLGGRPVKKEEEKPLTQNSTQGVFETPSKKPERKKKEKMRKREPTALEQASKKQGISRDTSRKWMELEDAAKGGDIEAQKQWARINKGISTNSCYTAWKNAKELEKKKLEQDQKSKEIIGDRLQLFNEDCFNILPKIKNGSVDLILADLPYGQTACDWDSMLPLDKLWEHYIRVLKETGVVILTASQPFTWKLCSSNPKWFKYEIIWEKPNGTNPLLVKVQPFRVHENILVFYKKQPTYNPQMLPGKPYNGFSDDNKTIGEIFSGSGSDKRGLVSKHRENPEGTRYPRSVIRCKQDRSGHPTKKPVELMSWLIKTYTNPNDLVMDNTMGEGTTGIACMIEGRRFIGIELEKSYYDIASDSIKKAQET